MPEADEQQLSCLEGQYERWIAAAKNPNIGKELN